MSQNPTLIKIDWISILIVLGALFVFRLCDRPEQPISFNTDALNAKIDSIYTEVKKIDSIQVNIYQELNLTYEKIDTINDDGLRDVLHSLPRRHNHNISK